MSTMARRVPRRLNTILVPAAWSTAAEWAGKARRERVSITYNQATTWFTVVELPTNETVGVAGITIEKGRARIRGILIDKAYRSRGHGERVVDALIALAQQKECSEVDAFAWNRAFYEGKNFRYHGQNAAGAAHMRRPL